MILETKFNLRDIVFYIKDNKIKNSEVLGISIYKDKCNHRTKYTLNVAHTTIELFESLLYSTKEEAAEKWLKQQGLEVGLK